MGLEGMKVYADTLQSLRKANIPVISDIKRGDIAATANAYACAHFLGNPVGAVVGCTQECDVRQLRDKYPNMFFLFPRYGAQDGAACIEATLLDKAGGTVNSSRGILCAWKKSSELANKREAQTLTCTEKASGIYYIVINIPSKKVPQPRQFYLLRAKKQMFCYHVQFQSTCGNCKFAGFGKG